MAQPHAAFTWCPVYDTLAQQCCIQFENLSTTGGNPVYYIYDFGDGQMGYQENPRHCYSAIGNYTVWIIVSDNQGMSSSTSHSINITHLDTTGCNCDSLIGISEPGSLHNIIGVFPNPIHGSGRLEVDSGRDAECRLVIYDYHGSVILEYSFTRLKSVSISREELPVGLYLFELVSRNGSRIGSGKFIVE